MCAQFVVDIGIETHDADHLITNLRPTLKCIQEAGLKHITHKRQFGAIEIDFLSRTITPQGVKPNTQIDQNFFEKKQISEVENGFAQDYPNAWHPSTRCLRVTKKS